MVRSQAQWIAQVSGGGTPRERQGATAGPGLQPLYRALQLTGILAELAFSHFARVA